MSISVTTTSSKITISGSYKDFTSGTGSTTNVINFSSGDAPATGDAGRFLMWRVNTSNTSTWEIRFIESATSTSVNVGDGGFSSAPPSNADFRISTNLDDIWSAVNSQGAMNRRGSNYEMINREWSLESDAFVADVDKSFQMTCTESTQWEPVAFAVQRFCAVQFGRLSGGENNNSFETTRGCRIHLSTKNTDKLIFGTRASNQTKGADSRDNGGCILNFYGCLLETTSSPYLLFIRAGGLIAINWNNSRWQHGR